MDLIISINFQNARNSEHNQFHHGSSNAMDDATAEKYGIKPIRDTYLNKFKEEERQFILSRKFPSTKKIEEANKKRSNCFIYLRDTVYAALYCPVENKRKAAEALAEVFEVYRTSNLKPHAEATAEIRNLLNDLYLEENVEHLNTLGLGEAVEFLTSANDSFEAIYDQRSEEKRIRVSTDSLKEIRQQVDEAYRAYANAINVLYQMNELVQKDATTRDELGLIINKINAQIVQLDETLSRRAARAENGEEEEEEEVLPEEPTDGDTVPTDPEV